MHSLAKSRYTAIFPYQLLIKQHMLGQQSKDISLEYQTSAESMCHNIISQ